MKYFFCKHEIVKHKIEKPIKNHVGRATEKVAKKRFRHYSPNWSDIKKINEMNSKSTD